jgi:hypothetical protein
MSYFIRFIQTDKETTTLPLLADWLRSVDPRYTIDEIGGVGEDEEVGMLRYDGVDYAALEIDRGGDMLADERTELIDEIGGSRRKNARSVKDIVAGAGLFLVAQVLWGDRKTDETLEKLAPIWEWLLTNRDGLVQADGEGYYDINGMVLKTG